MVKIMTWILVTLLIIWAIAGEQPSAPKHEPKCRVLALEGGGDKGSYEVGALKAFVELVPENELVYDVVTGVSVGAINAIAMALHEKGNEKECVNWMNQLWLNMSSSDIYQNWRFGLIEGIALREGLYDNSNEVKFLTDIFNKSFPEKKVYREVEWNTVDFDTAEIIRFNKNEEWDTIPKKIVASTSMPFAFPHLHMDGKTYVDGGTVWNLDISSGINKCLENGFEEKNIIVDAILCSGKRVAKRSDQQNYNTIQNYIRHWEISSYYTTMSDIDEIIRGYQKVEFRYVVIPERPLPSGYIPLGFKHDDIVLMIEQGYEEAKEVIKNHTNSSFHRVSQSMEELMNIYNPETTKNFKPMRIRPSF